MAQIGQFRRERLALFGGGLALCAEFLNFTGGLSQPGIQIFDRVAQFVALFGEGSHLLLGLVDLDGQHLGLILQLLAFVFERMDTRLRLGQLGGRFDRGRPQSVAFRSKRVDSRPCLVQFPRDQSPVLLFGFDGLERCPVFAPEGLGFFAGLC